MSGNNSNELMGMFASGLVGAILAQLLGCLWSYLDHRAKYRNLLNGIVAECKYCIPVADEICRGAIQGVSFKRMPVDYFRMVQERAVEYHMDEEVLTALAHVRVDLELFNFEVDYAFDGKKKRTVYQGIIENKRVGIEESWKEHDNDISPTILAARKGVVNSLRRLQEAAEMCITKTNTEAHYDKRLGDQLGDY